jgi:hypothetical protein
VGGDQRRFLDDPGFDDDRLVAVEPGVEIEVRHQLATMMASSSGSSDP